MLGPGLSEYAFNEFDPADAIGAAIAAQYFSTGGFTTEAGDTPPYQYFDGAVRQPLRIVRSIVGSGLGGLIDVGPGEIEIRNDDGTLDALLEGYAIDGRRVVVRMGRRGWSYAQFGTVFDGVAESWRAARDAVRITVQDGSYRLSKELQSTFYAGTGGAEGSSSVKGQPKPLAFGPCLNVPALLLSSADQLYQFHDGLAQGVDAVYDRGIQLVATSDFATPSLLLAATTGIGNTIEPGEYGTCLAQGMFRLGGAPAGQVTADVRGSAQPSYVTSTSDVIRRILQTYGGLTDDDLDLRAFARLNVDNAAPVGVWVAAPVTARDVVDSLIRAVGGFAGFTRTSKFQVGLVKAASGTPTHVFTRDDVEAGSLEQLELPPMMTPPTWRQRVMWGRNYLVQTDLAAATSNAHREFVAQPERLAVASDGSVTTRHLLASDPDPVTAYFAVEADAAAEAARQLALFGVQRHLYRFSVRRRFWDLELGSVIALTYPRYNLHGGKLARVVGIGIDAAARRATLEVLV